MARYRGPRVRIIRRLGSLPGLTQKSTQRDFPPGQHGPKKKPSPNQKMKESQYAVRLKEKQKLRFHYGVSEKQLIRYMREARRRKGSTGELLLQLLEMRLDNIVYRLGFTPTIPAARQLITHGHICINGQRVNIPSFMCTLKDTISVHEASRTSLKKSLENRVPPMIPSHIEVNFEKLTGVIQSVIPRDRVGLELNELLVVEYYSRKV
jgi:small subunit ribosomal protein S4